MGKRDVLAKALAIIGVVLVALPILAPLVFGLMAVARPGGFRFDYLMPFEIYPLTLVGLVLVLIASLRSRLRRRAVGISIGMMLGGVVLGAVAATVTGIANSVETLETWRYAVVIAFGAASIVGQVALIAVGVMLIRDLFGRKKAEPVDPGTLAAAG